MSACTTYVWAQGRWHYLAAVLDLLIGWAFSAKPDAELVIKALMPGPGEGHHAVDHAAPARRQEDQRHHHAQRLRPVRQRTRDPDLGKVVLYQLSYSRNGVP